MKPARLILKNMKPAKLILKMSWIKMISVMSYLVIEKIRVKTMTRIIKMSPKE